VWLPKLRVGSGTQSCGFERYTFLTPLPLGKVFRDDQHQKSNLSLFYKQQWVETAPLLLYSSHMQGRQTSNVLWALAKLHASRLLPPPSYPLSAGVSAGSSDDIADLSAAQRSDTNSTGQVTSTGGSSDSSSNSSSSSSSNSKYNGNSNSNSSSHGCSTVADLVRQLASQLSMQWGQLRGQVTGQIAHISLSLKGNSGWDGCLAYEKV